VFEFQLTRAYVSPMHRVHLFEPRAFLLVVRSGRVGRVGGDDRMQAGSTSSFAS
jgi:hypothetical protein